LHEPVKLVVDEREPKMIESPNEFSFPEEYAVSGWFMWSPIET
jgi:hypothetical protein